MPVPHMVDERAVLGSVFPWHVVVMLDRVGLVALDSEPSLNNERRELFPLHRAITVNVDLRKELAEVRDELSLREVAKPRVLLAATLGALHEPHHHVHKLGDREPAVLLLELAP
jgi:hypothetical protein